MRVSADVRAVRRLSAASAGQRGRLLLAGLLGALALGSSVGLMATSAFLISKAALMPPILHLQVAIVGVRAFGIGRGVFRYSERLAGHDAAFRGLADVRVRVYEGLERQAPIGLQGWRRGDLLTRLVADVDASVDLNLRVLLPYLSAFLVGIGSVALAWYLLPAAGLLLLAGLLVAGLAVPAVALAAASRASRQLAPAAGDFAARAVTALESRADLIALQAQDRALSDLVESDARVTDLQRRSALWLSAATGLQLLAQGLVVAGCLVAGTVAVRDSILEGVLLAVVVLMPLAAFEASLLLPAAVLTLAKVSGSARRVFEVVDAPDPSPDPQTPAIADPGQPAGQLEVRDLSATWPGGQRSAIAGVDLRLGPGSRVGVVGPSGSGKSTLAAALLKFLPAEGTLRLGGLDYADLSGEDVRRSVGLLAQDAHIFDTTVRENVLLARPSATDADLAGALALAGLQDWLADLPAGIDTFVGSHGSAVSGGQRQRIALARILLAEHPIVLLDEPTEHLDPETADAVLTDTMAALAERAVLLITHEVAQVRGFDEILLVADGRLQARGDHDTLLRISPHYAALADTGIRWEGLP